MVGVGIGSGDGIGGWGTDVDVRAGDVPCRLCQQCGWPAREMGIAGGARAG